MAKVEVKFDLEQEVAYTKDGQVTKGVTKNIRYDTTRKSFEYQIDNHRDHKVWIDQKYLKPWKGNKTRSASTPTGTRATARTGGVRVWFPNKTHQDFTSGTQAGKAMSEKYKMPYPKGNADAYAFLEKVARTHNISYARNK